MGLKGDKPEAFRMSTEDKQYYKKSKEIENLFLINVNRIKDNIANYMELEANQEFQPSNFMNFPNSGDGKYDYKNYFSHYEGEQKKIKKNANNIEYYLWERRHGKNNHFWDCAVYNYALKSIISDLICNEAGVPSSWNNTVLIMQNL